MSEGWFAQALLKRWLGDDSLVSDAAASAADVLKGRLTDRLAQQRARQQFETIGEKVGESSGRSLKWRGRHWMKDHGPR